MYATIFGNFHLWTFLNLVQSARPAKHPETQKRLESYDTPSCDFTAGEWLKIQDSMPFRALPVLEIDGIEAPICQSRAINRHCARLAGIEVWPRDSQFFTKLTEPVKSLAKGDTDEEKLLADMFADSAHEWVERFFGFHLPFLIGKDLGNMKAEKRWARWDAIPKGFRFLF